LTSRSRPHRHPAGLAAHGAGNVSIGAAASLTIHVTTAYGDITASSL
jgi:hypothetical protein